MIKYSTILLTREKHNIDSRNGNNVLFRDVKRSCSNRLKKNALKREKQDESDLRQLLCCPTSLFAWESNTSVWRSALRYKLPRAAVAPPVCLNS